MIATISSPSLRLPTDRPGSPARLYTHGHVDVLLTTEIDAQLRDLARQNAVRLLTTLLSSWVVLLTRWSGQRDFSVDVSGVAVTLPDDATVRQLLGRVETALAEAGDGVSPCQFMLDFIESTVAGSDISYRGTHTQCELLLYLREGANGLTGRLCFARELFDFPTIERLSRHWEVLLRGMATDACAPVGRLVLLTASERHRILYDFNSTTAAFPEGRLIHELLEEQVQRHSSAVAVSYKTQRLVYRELNSRANQLAHYLRERGVGPDKPVAICVERGIDMVIGLVAILKAGGAYVPLDPSYPGERLRYMLHDCKPVLLLTQHELEKRIVFGDVPLVALDTHWNDISLRPSHNLSSVSLELSPTNLAYIIYTSGSTGNPKGVMVEHRNVTRFLAAVDGYFEAGDGCSLFTSIAFDVSVLELWGALLSGARLVIVPYATSRFPKDLHALLVAERVSVLSQTPSAFRQLIAVRAGSLPSLSLRSIILGGEALQLKGLKPWYDREESDRAELTNMYGPTETTVYVTSRPVQCSDTDPHGGSLIGTPIPHSRIYILDGNLEPVPLGVVGEIYIGGTGVARGYHSRPALTAERFVADPFADSQSARMYRSGDLGLWRPDGTIEFLGRNDSQVKVRGFRMELGDIEAHLAACAGVREAVVLVRTEPPGDARLVAYLTAEDEVQLSASEVRAFLMQRLPIHMVPGEYLILPSLPLNANGKVDRKALPAPLAISASA